MSPDEFPRIDPKELLKKVSDQRAAGEKKLGDALRAVGLDPEKAEEMGVMKRAALLKEVGMGPGPDPDVPDMKDITPDKLLAWFAAQAAASKKAFDDSMKAMGIDPENPPMPKHLVQKQPEAPPVPKPEDMLKEYTVRREATEAKLVKMLKEMGIDPKEFFDPKPPDLGPLGL